MDLGNFLPDFDTDLASECIPFLLLLFMAPVEPWSSTKSSEALEGETGL